MYEMQGPHVAWQRADLPIPRLIYASPGVPPYLQPWRYPVSRSPHNSGGRPPGVDCSSGGECISTASDRACARAFVNLFKILL